VQDFTLYEQFLTAQIGLMVKLMESPNATAQISLDPPILGQLASLLNSRETVAYTRPRAMFEELVRRTLRHLVVDKNDRSSKYLRTLVTLLRESIQPAELSNGSLGTVSLVKAALPLLANGSLVSDEVALLSVLYLNYLAGELSRLTTDRSVHDSTAELDEICDAIGAFPQLSDEMKQSDGIDAAWSKIDQSVDHCLRENEETAAISLPLLRVSARIKDWRKFIKQSTLYLKHATAPRERLQALSILQNVLIRRSQGVSDDLPVDWSSTEVPENSIAAVQTARLLVASSSPERPEQPAAIVDHFIRGLPTITNPAIFDEAAWLIHMAIREKPFLISQHNIDTFLATSLAVASPTGPRLPAQYAPAIFLLLCDTNTAIVSLHRAKLGGRHHLLVPLLQHLLACLFIPHNTTNARASSISRPPWLSPMATPLTTKQAAAFTRLLTTLCSPTVSSVSKRRRTANGSRKLNLVNETKKARNYVGQYITLLLAEFCSLSLKGRMTPELRRALMPGIWAAMECVDKEGMRALSEGLDARGRAIWGSLFGEWRRSGGGAGRAD